MTNELFGTLFSSRDNQYDEVMQRMNGIRDEVTKIGQQQTQIDNKLTEQIDELKDELTTLHEDHKRETEKLWDQLLVQKAQYESLVSSLRVPTAEEKRDKLVVEITEMLETVKQCPPELSRFNEQCVNAHYPIFTMAEYFDKYFKQYSGILNITGRQEISQIPNVIFINYPGGQHKIYRFESPAGSYYNLRGWCDPFENMPSYNFNFEEFVKNYLTNYTNHLLQTGSRQSFRWVDQMITLLMDNLPRHWIMPTLPNETETEYEVRVLEHIRSYIKFHVEGPYKKYNIWKSFNRWDFLA